MLMGIILLFQFKNSIFHDLVWFLQIFDSFLIDFQSFIFLFDHLDNLINLFSQVLGPSLYLLFSPFQNKYLLC